MYEMYVLEICYIILYIFFRVWLTWSFYEYCRRIICIYIYYICTLGIQKDSKQQGPGVCVIGIPDSLKKACK